MEAAWLVAPVSAIYLGLSVALLVRPQLIRNNWPVWKKRITTVPMVATGALFVFLAVAIVVTGRCLGTDLNARR